MVRARLQAALQRWRVSLSFAFSVVAILMAEPTVRLILIGGSLSLLGAALRAWAAGYLKKDQELSTGGPYAYTRNPLYLGSFFIGLGVVIACGSWLLLVLFLILFFLLFSSAMTGEASHLMRLFPDEYLHYQKSVPVFFPRLTPYQGGAATGQFSFTRYKTHHEYRVVLVLLLVLALLLAKAVWVHAGLALAQEDQPKGIGSRLGRLPFAEGETLNYEARFSKLFISGKIGRITFTFSRSTEPPLVGVYLIKAVAVPEGFWTSLLGIDVRNVLESFVDPTDFGVLRTREEFSQGREKDFQLAIFDRKSSTVMVIKRDLADIKAQPKVSQEPTRSWVQDVVSATYYVRTLPLTVGETIEIPLSDSGKTFAIQVKVLAQEQIQIDLGRFSTVKLQPLIFGEGNLIRKPGELYIWITDDAHRIPVRALMQGSFGTATIELTSMLGVP